MGGPREAQVTIRNGWETPARISAVESLSTKVGQEADMRYEAGAVAEPKAQTDAVQTSEGPALWVPVPLGTALLSS